jgi:hypothetical protein
MTGWQRKAYLDGDWDIAAGQFFTTFREDIHVIKPYSELPANWQTWASFDYGFTHFTACHAFAKDSDGNVIVWGEYGAQKKLPQFHAEGIKAMLAREGRSVQSLRKFVAGHDIFADTGRKGADNKTQTIAEDYASLGIPLVRANIDRINGAAEILALLGDSDSVPPQPPKLFIYETCVRLIEVLPSLVHDPHRPEDVLKVDCSEDGDGGDDFYDSFRYGVMADYADNHANALDALRKLIGNK